MNSNDEGLNMLFYCGNIHSVLTYASPVLYTHLSDDAKCELEKSKTQLGRQPPSLFYLFWIIMTGCLFEWSLDLFIKQTSENHFLKIREDKNHPLFSGVNFKRKDPLAYCNKLSTDHLDVVLKREAAAADFFHLYASF